MEIAGNVFHLFFKRWLSVLESIFDFNVSLNFSEGGKKTDAKGSNSEFEMCGTSDVFSTL